MTAMNKYNFEILVHTVQFTLEFMDIYCIIHMGDDEKCWLLDIMVQLLIVGII